VFRDAALVFTAVCPGNIRDAATYLRAHFLRWLREAGSDCFKNIFCCENMNRSSTTFRDILFEGLSVEEKAALSDRVGFPDTMIARVVARPTDPLSLLGEDYSEWTADKRALRGARLPAVHTLELVEDQTAYLQRKLYIHNTGHATVGFLGFLKGYTYIHEAGQDAEILDVCRNATEESGWAIERQFGFSAENISAYREVLFEKLTSPDLPDEILRVVREPARKLGPEERFLGPAQLMLKHGREPEHLLYGVCAALLCRIPGDAQSESIAAAMAAKGSACLSDIAGVPIDSRMSARVQQLLPAIGRRFGRPA